MTARRLRAIISLGIILLTGWLFIRYVQQHSAYITELRHVGWGWAASIIIVDLLAITTLAFLYQVLVQMAGKRLSASENWLLTIYSSIANFFGPLQSGPGVRAAYLKSKHKVKLRLYIAATLLSYAVYAVLSAFCLFVGTRPWWQTTLACVVAGIVSYGVIQIVRRRRGGAEDLQLTPRLVGGLIGFTALQVSLIAVRYYLALRATGAQVSIGQALSYTGAANFSLFVSLTPDGVGIREAFLLFSQQVHHVSTHAIVAANILDRATFVIFLAILFAIALMLHAKERFAPAPRRDES